MIIPVARPNSSAKMRTNTYRADSRFSQNHLFVRISFSSLSIPYSCVRWVVYRCVYLPVAFYLVSLSLSLLVYQFLCSLLRSQRATKYDAYALPDFTTASFSLMKISAQTVSLWGASGMVSYLHSPDIPRYSAILSLLNIVTFRVRVQRPILKASGLKSLAMLTPVCRNLFLLHNHNVSSSRDATGCRSEEGLK